MLDDLILHPQKREELARRGGARSQAFTWAQAAEQTLAVYRRAIGQT
jgi:hypothetical protein